MSSASPPSLPSDYVVPEVWGHDSDASPSLPFPGNRPSAGARFEAPLPLGARPLQLYSAGTPNGVKVTILLEELGLPFDGWRVDIRKAQQFGSGFVAANPNSKIPTLMDHSVEPPLRVFESGSILWYLAETYGDGRFIPSDPRLKTECINWLMWQMGTAPYLGGGFGHFYNYAPVKIEYAIDRFAMEAKRIVDVLDKQLEGKEYVCGDEYTIADMAIMPWINCLGFHYKADKFLSLQQYTNVNRWMEKLKSRDAVKRGMAYTYTEMPEPAGGSH